MLKRMLEKVGIKNIEEGELIRPIDEYKTKNVFCDKELIKKCKETIFTKDDEFEVQSVTAHEVVAYVKSKKVYVVIDKNDFSEFEDVE